MVSATRRRGAVAYLYLRAATRSRSVGRPGWSVIPAVQDHEVIPLNDDGASRWGPRLPQLVAQIEYADWTDVNHLRHSKFIALRQDKNPRDVVRE